MFFPRLRRQAKWMFVFLAVIFGLGYVIFNVGGSIPGTGLGDVLQGLGQSADTGPSVDDSREKIRERPNDPAGYRNLATALQRQGRNTEAIEPLENYVRLRPKDRDALQQLAGLHLAQARTHEEQGTAARARLTEITGADVFTPSSQSQFSQQFGNPQITSIEATKLNQQLNQAFLGVQESYKEATTVLQRLIAVTPDELEADEPLVFLQLGSAAASAGDLKAAVKAYERYLEVAPDSASAASVRAQLPQLRQAANPGKGKG
ncbi:MAG: tetratricopeptide repeat protein [Actinobacteria bacterium]|nr:tetratricopeptide repeat protein [Actinomycetota bacterium]